MLCLEGVDTRIYGHFFVVVVHSVLLFGSELWVFTPIILQSLGIFQYSGNKKDSGLDAAVLERPLGVTPDW